MRTKDFTKTLSIFFLLITFFSNNVWADSSKNRFRSCTPAAGVSGGGNAHPEGLDFDPTGGGKDFVYEMDNPICQAVVLPPYAAVKLAIAAMNGICGSGSAIPRVLPSIFLDIIDVANAGKRASGNAACVAAIATAVSTLSGMIAAVGFQYLNAEDAYKNSWLCGGGDDENWTRWNSVSMSKDIYDKKLRVEEKVKSWIENCKSEPTSSDCNLLQNGLSNADYRQWYYNGVEKEDTGDSACPDVNRRFGDWAGDKNKVRYNDSTYPAQRYYMRGTEPGNYACDRYNVRLVKNDPFTSQPLSKARVDDYNYAYQCCIKRSKETVCIERRYCKSGGYLATCPGSADWNSDVIDTGGHDVDVGTNDDGDVDVDVDINTVNNVVVEHKFCKGGEFCSIGPDVSKATYSAAYEDNKRMICVSSYNMCPYNFNIGGGSTECDMFKDGKTNHGVFTPVSPADIAAQNCQGKSDIRNNDCSINDKASKCKNYCQYLNHCVIVAGNDYIYDTSIVSPYFSSACINFVGDSKNSYGYDTGIFAGQLRHFTAPMAQCIKETLENVFYNHAGHTKCGTVGEYPDQNGNCYTDFYKYKKGKYVDGQKSFFLAFQDAIRDIIKTVLTVFVTIFGIKILMGGQVPKAPELVMLALKLSLIIYFVLGDAWQSTFFNGVYNTSATFSTIVMNIRTDVEEEKRDGCQFGKISVANGSSVVVSDYPQGKQYLAVFDTLDCKIAMYLGFGPGFSVANIAKLILAGFFTGPIGVYFSVMMLMFGLYIISMAFKVLHIFIVSAFGIILIVYVSPITIPCLLFKRTEGMFGRWLNQLMGLCLQPILLFAYVGLFITVFDSLMLGSATFSGNPPQKTIICDKKCQDKNGVFVNMPAREVTERCDVENGQKIVDPMSDSVACMMNLKNDKFGKVPVLEPLGVALPMLKNFFSEEGRLKILTITKALIVIYILSQFVGEIPGIAMHLMGGGDLSSGQTVPINLDVKKMRENMAGVASAIQKRGMGAARKAGRGASSAAGNAKDAAKNIAGQMGSKTRSNSANSGNSGNDVDKTN